MFGVTAHDRHTAGGDAFITARSGELLRSLLILALEMLRLPGNEHEKICFDCRNQRSLRLEEHMAAKVAADKVRLRVCLISSRRCLRASGALCIWRWEQEDLVTESEGEGTRRFVVVYPRGRNPRPGWVRQFTAMRIWADCPPGRQESLSVPMGLVPS